MKRMQHSYLLLLSGRERGQTIVETILSMIFLCLLIFGLLQVFHIAVASLVTKYSAFYAARSYAVGFSDEGHGARWNRQLVYKAARVRAIPASGRRIFPSGTDSEQSVIWRYLTDTNQWLEYEYWWGENYYDYLFYRDGVQPPSTFFSINARTTTATYMVDMDAGFNNYPFPIFDLMDPDRVWFDGVEDVSNIRANSTMFNNAEDYMQE